MSGLSILPAVSYAFEETAYWLPSAHTGTLVHFQEVVPEEVNNSSVLVQVDPVQYVVSEIFLIVIFTDDTTPGKHP